jgi:hypothetical protein
MKNAKNSFENSNYLLSNVSNYKENIEYSAPEILKNFVSALIEYMRFIAEKITMKNKPYYRFIFEKGIEMLIHIFSLIFYYTKNLELSIYHMKKSYYFYIEFIEQISDNNVTFLQLSSRDAILFVYKRTIFELNQEYRKNMEEPTIEEKNILSIVDSYINIYKSITEFLINHKEFKYDTKEEYINVGCDCIEYITGSIHKNKIKKNLINCVYLFTSILVDKEIGILDFFKILDDFIKNISIKKKLDEKKVKNRIYDEEINTIIINKEYDKIVDKIFT